jgi:CheY-like chemotaxis protein/chemotaxis signal transduction protein
MDLGEIKQNALRKGLVSEGILSRMTDREVLNIVFLNGYSSSPVVTEVSGRGMGLDIVMRDITRLKGRVTLDTQKNRGTKFTLVLPLSIAIIQSLFVKVEDMRYALPMASVKECLRLDQEEISTIEGGEAISFHEHIIPLVRLSERLGLVVPHGKEERAEKTRWVVVVATFDRQIGLIVDEIIGEDEVFIKSLGKHLGKVRYVSGAAVMSDGDVVVVLDIEDLMAYSGLQPQPSREERFPPKGIRKNTRILLVEDAFSTRELERSILENHGYLVDTAVDGLDALNRITGQSYDLIVSDIEMPRMDGFELCKTLKKNEAYKDIPILMLTALQKEEDKRRGIEVGAAAYLIKNSFDQNNLLDTIERLIG